MDISRQLNELLEKYECTAKELAEEADLSVSVISRYRNGKRSPSKKQLEKLAKGFEVIAKKRGTVFDAGKITDISQGAETDTDMFIRKFNILVSTLDINMNDFARFFNYDPSFISRVRSKQRSISDVKGFAKKTGEFLNLKYRNEEYDKMILTLTGTEEPIKSGEQYVRMVEEWLCSKKSEGKSILRRLADNFEDFDIQEYFAEGAFEVTKREYPPKVTYERNYGNSEMMCRGELDFLKEVLMSENTKEIFLFNEMPHMMFERKEFSDEWLFLMWKIVRKGIKVNIIHKIDRPFNDIILAFEKVIPLYLTGEVQAYYVSSGRQNVYYHICNYSEEAVMYGTGIYTSSEHAGFVISRNQKDIEYCKEEIRLLLEKARPLMNVYTERSEKMYRQFVRTDVQTTGERAGLFSVPPLYTMKEELLLSILKRHHTDEEETKKILEGYREMQNNVNNILKGGKMREIVSIVSEEEFRKRPLNIMSSYTFPKKNYSYSYEEYLEHQRQTLEFVQSHTGYSVKLIDTQYLKNINVIMHKEKWVIVSRVGSPGIHLVIRHPYMRRAVENISFLLSAE